MKIAALISLMVGLSSVALAAGPTRLVPEISPVSAAGALTLLSGALLIIRGRQRK